jgi:hypothetical protein
MNCSLKDFMKALEDAQSQWENLRVIDAKSVDADTVQVTIKGEKKPPCQIIKFR